MKNLILKKASILLLSFGVSWTLSFSQITQNKSSNLPIPTIPEPPITTNVTTCESDKTVFLKAFSPQDVVIDWYDKPLGGMLLGKSVFFFFPPREGTYYAEARFEASGQVSLSRTPARLKKIRQICPQISVRLIKNTK